MFNTVFNNNFKNYEHNLHTPDENIASCSRSNMRQDSNESLRAPSNITRLNGIAETHDDSSSHISTNECLVDMNSLDQENEIDNEFDEYYCHAVINPQLKPDKCVSIDGKNFNEKLSEIKRPLEKLHCIKYYPNQRVILPGIHDRSANKILTDLHHLNKLIMKSCLIGGGLGYLTGIVIEAAGKKPLFTPLTAACFIPAGIGAAYFCTAFACKIGMNITNLNRFTQTYLKAEIELSKDKVSQCKVSIEGGDVIV